MAAAKPSDSGRAGPAGSSRAESRTSVPALPVAGALDAPSCGRSKVAGMGRIRHRLGGQMITKARPITAFSGTVPPPGSPRWSLESSEMSRWSPMTQSRPVWTTMLNLAWEGASPGYRYDCSLSGTPLTVT